VKASAFHLLAEPGDGNERKTVRRLSWDFGSCADDEVDECHAYEFARHVTLIREDVASLRKGKQQSFDRLFTALREIVFGPPVARCYALFWFYPEFPEKPYLEIPVEERRRRMKVAWPSTEQAARASMLSPKTLSQFLANDLRAGLRKLGRPSVRYGVFELALLQIDWNDSNTQLLEAFAAWLSEHRPADVVMWQDKGAGNFIRKKRVDLKSLSAWRLLKWTDSWEEAYLVSSGDGRSKGLYSNHPKP
jgi:hypothetical protein